MREVLAVVLYPAYLFGSLMWVGFAIALDWNLAWAAGLKSGFIVLSLMLLEAIYPVRTDWRMNGRGFLRDIKYIASGIVTAGITRWLGGLIALGMAFSGNGPARDLPLWLAVPLMILTFDFFQYWLHRACHEMEGPLGRFLWRVHAAHHLPDRVYVLMHAVGHPLNFAAIQWGIIGLVIVWPGYSPEAILIFSTILGVNGTFSHFNMVIRAGWLNYVFVGTELHRYHHSADLRESKNYGAVTPVWDLLFGTFVYKPGRVPLRLGVADPESYPDSSSFWRVMALPFPERCPLRRLLRAT